MTPLLQAADNLLTGDAAGTRGMWPRVTAVLVRGALEDALDELWDATEPACKDASGRAQLLLLPHYLTDDPDLVADVREAWSGLSRACHHHAYELPPTSAELRGWWVTVDRLSAACARRALEGRTSRDKV